MSRLFIYLAVLTTLNACKTPETPHSETKESFWDRMGQRSNPDQATLDKCLEKWNDHPFQSPAEYRKIRAAVGWNRQDKMVIDSHTTRDPELVLVPAIVAVFGKVTYKLQNPNGWYCLATTVGVRGETEVQVLKTAHLADSVKVHIGARDQHPGLVNVNVDGDVKVVVLP